MDKQTFQSYCDKMAYMGACVPDWYNRPHSIIADYLQGRTTYGFGQVLAQLLTPAYQLLTAHTCGGKMANESDDFYEFASLLSVTTAIDGYRFAAYYFAICVAQVSFFGAPLDAIDCDLFDENELMAFDDSIAISEVADPQLKQLKRYSIRLLDFSRNNQLVHFHPIKSATLLLHSADTVKTLQQITSGRSKLYLAGWKKLQPKMAYKCKLCGKVEFFAYDFAAKKSQPAKECPDCDAFNTHNRKSMVPLREQLVSMPADGYRCLCGNKQSLEELARSNLVCPFCGKVITDCAPIVCRDDLKKYADKELVSGISDSATAEVAKTLLNKAKNMERNFGLHVLYLACGFLKWKDTNGTGYNSPILLCPINLNIDKAKGQYYFEADPSADSMFEVNKTLIQMLSAYSQTCSITLPPLDKTNIGVYFSLLKRSFQNGSDSVCEITKDWEIDTGFGIGLFHYQKLQLQNDIEVNRSHYLQHPIIRRLCGAEDAAIDPPASQQRYATQYLLLDADSSQEDVIKAAQEGKSFILQGPPGSGKSQTITNIISSALGEGKTVLFVTEKSSARSVIIDNLLRCSADDDKKLTDFVLDFDTFKKRSGAVCRSPFIDELNRCLNPYTPMGGYDDQLLADEVLRHEQIKQFMLQMRGQYDGRNYLRLLQNEAQYSAFAPLAESSCVPTDSIEFHALCDNIHNYFGQIAKLEPSLDYRKHPLYGCKGDLHNGLYKTASAYMATYDSIAAAVCELKNLGWNANCKLDTIQACIDQIRLWLKMPMLTQEILAELSSEKKAKELLSRAKKRKETVQALAAHSGALYAAQINKAKFEALDLADATVSCKYFVSVFKRWGKKYHQWLADVLGCFKTTPDKLNYKSATEALDKLSTYKDYVELKASNETQAAEDLAIFGYEPKDENEWNELLRKLNAAKSVLSYCDGKILSPKNRANWLLRFDPLEHAATLDRLQAIGKQLLAAQTAEREQGADISVYMQTPSDGFFAYKTMAENVIKHHTVLSDWHDLYGRVQEIETKGWLPVLHELIDAQADIDQIMSRLHKTHYQNIINDFTDKHKLDRLRKFRRTEHEKLLADYANADRQVLSTGSRRLYEVLSAYLRQAAYDRSGRMSDKYPKLRSKTNYSIKQTVMEDWEYIKHIKPCFMMSPLNVSQYVDVNLRFDLVIFDEASQIFTEDALASIVRGKQVIIAGDSKQLPPCDFFRAGESMLDDDDQYFEENANSENSLLTAADEKLSDASIALTWHYRSCDEALIAFANKEMDYNLITFPSATHNANDGICYIPVPYTPTDCYVAGKRGAHINPGEADRIVELIYSEMTHPERSAFSIGVVAFSNAQAFEIESRWEAFRQRPDKKATIEAWEKSHEKEPLIFCNLDTVQGDERDTVMLSVCYSRDLNGKFILPYLGRIRLRSGKKRLNVAITRAKHRMMVVSTLTSGELAAAIHSSSAPEDNKAGAQMLCHFLEYAESFTTARETVCGKSHNPFVTTICRLLDQKGIQYDTEIGRSDCKINIGIRAANEKDSFVLGIIIDDPSRADFDSVREYARLTEQVLSHKYGWTIYRVFPIAWIDDYENEKQRLFDAIEQASTVGA